MYIEEVILDGFKSYATRTVVSGFDPYFNAVTGLNGSGKSNILDAICFVLGITNLSQVRVGNLQELVYKQGQAGVTKASVTIVFNNENPKQSPVGYEQYDKITVTRQVVIGGRNKYLINGHNAQANRVQNLFHSVQLNVNNPHFLIMQGKINKVIHMKPPEILAMIEEAAGTRMFEMKKQAALKTISKKEKKVEEIQRVLNEEITPTLQNLQKERAQYNTFLKNQSSIETLTRVTVAYEYGKSQELLKTSTSDVAAMEESRDTLTARVAEISRELERKKNKIAELVDQKEKEMEGGFKALERKSSELSKEFVKLSAELKHLEEALKAEEQNSKNLEKSRTELKQAIVSKKKELEEIKGACKKIEEKNVEHTSTLAYFQRKYQSVSTGVSADPDGEKTLATKLMDAERDVVTATTETEQAQIKLKHLTNELKEKTAAAKTVGKEYTALKQELDTTTKAVEELKKSLGNLKYDEKREHELTARRRSEEELVTKLREEVDILSAQLSSIEFSYSDPEKNFDRKKVKGLVANLIEIKDHKATTALEVTCGGKLYNVVVDSEETGKQLLKNGKLKKRVTIIPLNKINKRTIDPKKLEAAQKLVGAENVNVALSFVAYDNDIEAAMNFVFGNTLICTDSASAKKVTFGVGARSVTLEGDVFDPAGTLTGGSRPKASSVLDKLQKLNEKKSELSEHENILRKIREELENMRGVAGEFSAKKSKYELKAHELELLKDRIGQNAHHQVLEKVKEIENEMEAAKVSMETLKDRKAASMKLCEELKNQMKNFNSTRESKLKELEKSIAAIKGKVASSTKELKDWHQKMEQISLESQELEAELLTVEEQIENSKESSQTAQQQVEAKSKEVAKKKAKYEAAQEEVESKRESLAACDKNISAIVKERDNLSQEMTDSDIELKKLEHKIARYHKDKKDAAKFVEHLEAKYSWIATEKQYFGKPNTDYDFKSMNISNIQKDLNRMQEEQAKLSKQINKKVMSMLEKAEQEYNELVQKKKIIEQDKEKIEAVINELDDKKNEALKTTWQKVNKDFGSIFSTLLPGTTAKLEPPEGESVLAGLEMKVAFGGVWKDSLSELSGGQRSLLALSLILALLLFKPAPMYILDEIDAALDLSHTQNIGQMLKTHFSQSQFIVVSLKEDMFRNANVLFRTKFVDGVSAVTRTKRTTK